VCCTVILLGRTNNSFVKIEGSNLGVSHYSNLAINASPALSLPQNIQANENLLEQLNQLFKEFKLDIVDLAHNWSKDRIYKFYNDWRNKFRYMAHRYNNSYNTTETPSIIWIIILINIIIFLMWYFVHQKFMYLFFTTSVTHVNSGRIYSLLTAGFSHKQLWHLVPNLLLLYFVGPPVIAIMGPSAFLLLYLSGIIIGNTSLVLYENMVKKENYIMLSIFWEQVVV